MRHKQRARLEDMTNKLPAAMVGRARSWIGRATRRRNGHGRLGELVLKRGLITKEQLNEALLAQEALERIGMPERIGTILVKKKVISEDVLNEVLRAG